MSTAYINIAENTDRTSHMQVHLKTGATDVQIVSLVTEVKAVILGKVRDASKSIDVVGFTPDAGAAPKGAQRGQKWLVRGTGVDGKIHHLTIPTADSSDIAAAGADTMDLTANAALVTAIQNVWGDSAGNAVTVNQIIYHNYTLQ